MKPRHPALDPIGNILLGAIIGILLAMLVVHVAGHLPIDPAFQG